MIIKIDEELYLQQLLLSDALEIFNTINAEREYLGKWLPFVEYTLEIKDTETFVNSIVNAPEDRFEDVFTIRYKDKFIGMIGFKNTDVTNKKTEIGYWMSEKYQGQGIATRSVAMLCDFAFNEKGINRIQIKCAVGNQPSINIPKRLGFRFEGVEHDGELLSDNKFTDLEVYSKLKPRNK